MTVFEKIVELFDSKKILYEVIEHEPVYTSADAARIRDTGLANGAKALIFLADRKPILVVLPGDKKVDTKEFKRLFTIKDLEMASKDGVFKITGLEVGSIPPVGAVLDLKSYFDESFKAKDIIAFNAGSHSKSIRMRALDLMAIEKPSFGNYVLKDEKEKV